MNALALCAIRELVGIARTYAAALAVEDPQVRALCLNYARARAEWALKQWGEEHGY